MITVSEPTDPSVQLERTLQLTNQKNLAEQDAKFNELADLYCNICKSRVIENTKHCAICNRCCHEFDHHCHWVNNDIGESNYTLFLRLLILVILTLTAQSTICIFSMTTADQLFLDSSESLISFDRLIILNGFTLVFAQIFLALITYLLFFHIWLIRRNLSTFKHLKLKQSN